MLKTLEEPPAVRAPAAAHRPPRGRAGRRSPRAASRCASTRCRAARIARAARRAWSRRARAARARAWRWATRGSRARLAGEEGARAARGAPRSSCARALAGDDRAAPVDWGCSSAHARRAPRRASARRSAWRAELELLPEQGAQTPRARRRSRRGAAASAARARARSTSRCAWRSCGCATCCACAKGRRELVLRGRPPRPSSQQDAQGAAAARLRDAIELVARHAPEPGAERLRGARAGGARLPAAQALLRPSRVLGSRSARGSARARRCRTP